jgi:hypothetical protein
MKFPSPILKLSLPLAVTFLAVPLTAFASDLIMPAGSVIQCTVSEPKISSKVDKIGDPVLCQVSHSELYGRSVVPFGSYMVGHFEDYKDPGHFVGKGWIELRFDRMILPGDTVIPLDARVISVPNYPVDSDGRIHGTGHAVKDTVEWFIPVLWPLDLINLPRRGPRVVLKAETRLTLKVMDDVGVSAEQLADQQDIQSGLLQRSQPAPIVQAYAQPAPAPAPAPQAAPQTVIYNNYPAPQQPPQQQQQVVVVQQPAPQVVPRPVYPVYAYPPPPPAYGYGYYARP